MLSSVPKNTKRILKYAFGIVLTAILFWQLYVQIAPKLELWRTGKVSIHYGPAWMLICVILLLPVNLLLEARKWQILAGTAGPLSFGAALASVLGGITFSLITPNRIGEYPGRILYLRHPESSRLVSVSVLGACAQLLSVLIFGLLGLICFSMLRPGFWSLFALIADIVAVIIMSFLFWRFEYWAPLIERIRWLHKLELYARLLRRFKTRDQVVILALSLLRYATYTLQFFLLLRWMDVTLPIVTGLLLCALFFWAMAVIPSIALAELGIRGQAGLFLFGMLSANTPGILLATASLWLFNLVLPTLIGTALYWRQKILLTD